MFPLRSRAARVTHLTLERRSHAARAWPERYRKCVLRAG
jgi:hypothetical protein